MKMDTSFWTGLSPTPKFVNTTKLFYNKYLYKIELQVNGLTNYIRWKSYYRDKLLNEFSKRYEDRFGLTINKKLIESICNFLDDTQLKQRTEMGCISLYSNDLNDFKPLIDCLIKENACEILKTVHLPPGNVDTENAIKSGKIYVKRIPDKFKYKITLKPS